MASSRVTDDLMRQRKDILARIAHLESRLGEWRTDLQQIDIALAAIAGSLERAAVARTQAVELAEPGSRTTIQDMVMSILGVLPKGATATELLDHIKNRFKVEVERSSLSPQLSRLKQDGRIDLIGRTWVAKHVDRPGLNIDDAVHALNELTEIEVPDLDFEAADIDLPPLRLELKLPNLETEDTVLGLDAMLRALREPASESVRHRPRLSRNNDNA